jgi:hypothetical protein
MREELNRHNFAPVEVLVDGLRLNVPRTRARCCLIRATGLGGCQVGLVAGSLLPSIAVTGMTGLPQAFTQNGKPEQVTVPMGNELRRRHLFLQASERIR